MSNKKIKESYLQIIPNTPIFSRVSLGNIYKKEIINLDVKKSSSSKSIPATILKLSADIYLLFLTNSINHSLHENTFLDELKKSEVIPLYKKVDMLKKENYRPISLLPHVSKVLERTLYKQIMSYMNILLSIYITGFRKLRGSPMWIIKI